MRYLRRESITFTSGWGTGLRPVPQASRNAVHPVVAGTTDRSLPRGVDGTIHSTEAMGVIRY